MASYSGDYYFDSGALQKSASLRVFAVDLDNTQNALNGTSRETSQNFDLTYLPEVFVNHVFVKNSCCTLPITGLRHVRLFLSSSTYLFVPLPFNGDSSFFLFFLQQIESNNNIIRFERYGEIVQDQFIRRFVN